MKLLNKNFAVVALGVGLASAGFAQAPADQSAAAAPAPAAPAAPTALSTPSVTGPLSNLPPAVFDAGPLGKLDFNGIISGMGMFQNNHIPGDNQQQAALTNGQIFIQKTDGVFQFYVQAGAYDIPSLGTPFVPTNETTTGLYGAVPVGFVKLQAGKNTSFQVGSLPTLIGAEYTFTFENMNIERGLLWNQEPAVSRGVQVNQTMGKVSASVSWNDGFYSNRYNWVTGSLAFASGPHALSFVAGANMGKTAFTSFSTPVQNNSSIYNLIYTYTKGAWIIQPYWQYTQIPADAKLGIAKTTSTNGGAILVSHAFKKGFSLAGRWEYIGSSGSAAQDALNLLYGPGSKATSVTVTPTFQYGGLFFRGDISYVHAGSYTPGDVFGSKGNDQNQTRAMAEIGFIFGNNIVEKSK